MVNHLEKLLYLRGVASEYFNYSGERVVVEYGERLKLLEAVGYDLGDDEAIQSAIFEIDALPWQSWLQPFNVLTQGDEQSIEIRVNPDEKLLPLHWQVVAESGELFGGQLIAGELPEVGEYYIDGIRYTAHQFLVAGLPVGYHEILLSSEQRQLRAVLAVAPKRCFEINNGNQAAAPAKRLLGITCQLYTLRSQRNWGMGDFTDLRELVALGAAANMDLIALNPLHAPHLAGEDFASPYSPSDRRFLNPLYIDPEQVQEFGESASVTRHWQNPTVQEKLAALRAASLVDYAGVAAVKYAVYELMFQHFLEHHLQPASGRAVAFDLFVRQRGATLQAFCEHESAQSGLLVAAAKDPRFHQYLQWLADVQLQQCHSEALDLGMQIGLMRDLAVGAIFGGAEVETKSGLFCAEATVGAPPDPFSDDGQNWNLPALDPIALRRDNYRHFIDLLQANMLHCGALRIDHVMGLLRLWWCLPNVTGGAYVYYPFEELLAIVRIESHRHQCMVIGEDMGVVPAELRDRMTATAIYSNKVFYFERHHDQQFKQPHEQQTDALLMVTNHDVSTLAGWWNSADLLLRRDCGLLDAESELPPLLEERQRDKLAVLIWLEQQQLRPADRDIDIEKLYKPFDLNLCGAILAANARSQSCIMLFQLEDLQLLEEPVNIPGTYREYPNWRRKQRLETSVLFSDPQIQALIATTYLERQL